MKTTIGKLKVGDRISCPDDGYPERIVRLDAKAWTFGKAAVKSYTAARRKSHYRAQHCKHEHTQRIEGEVNLLA